VFLCSVSGCCIIRWHRCGQFNKFPEEVCLFLQKFAFQLCDVIFPRSLCLRQLLHLTLQFLVCGGERCPVLDLVAKPLGQLDVQPLRSE
jgi:hypothetical protein